MKAAEQGFAEAQCNLGHYYEKGKGVAKNIVEAVKWYTKAAEQGCAEAQYSLACCYSKGQGVKKDDVEAKKWYAKAAEQGNKKAQALLKASEAEVSEAGIKTKKRDKKGCVPKQKKVSPQCHKTLKAAKSVLQKRHRKPPKLAK
jgi:TPR repeat protein